MGKFRDLTGQKFGRLTVVEYAGHLGKCKSTAWRCLCDCGQEKIVRSASLLNGSTLSCGCLAKELSSIRSTKDLVGQKFGRLTVMSRAGSIKTSFGTEATWVCRCDCGTVKTIRGRNFTSGDTKSCGCYKSEISSRSGIKNTKHGGCRRVVARDRLFNTWAKMRQRCTKESDPVYKSYGGRGIKVCDEWLGENGYANFRKWAYENGYDETAPRGQCTIDRIDNNGNYCPENCRIATQKQQSNNTRRNRIIEFRGETHTMSEWADITGLSYSALLHRFCRGWDVERALTEPQHNNMTTRRKDQHENKTDVQSKF